MFKRTSGSDFIHFQLADGEWKVAFKKGKTILEIALANKIPLDHSCEAGTCGSCRVFIDEPHALAKRGSVEAGTARERRFASNERLACQVEACPGLKVKIPEP